MMRSTFLVLTLGMAFGSPGLAQPAQHAVRIITSDQASSCEYVDIVSAMRFAALRSASRTARAAMTAALDKAAEAGANAAVVTSVTVSNNQHQVTLTAYRCADPPAVGERG